MHAPLLVFLLALLAGPASAQSPTTEPYDTRATPLDDLSRELLLETGYVIRDDGKIWDNIADSAVRRDEMSYLLARLAGARRLKALLELNLILNRSKGVKKLTEDERERVRDILRKHWAVFGVGTRKDFRSFFSVKELTEELDKIPPRFDRGSALLMRDPDPNTAPSRTAVAAPVSVTAPAPAETYAPVPVPAAEPAPAPRAAAPRQFIPRSVLTPFLPPPSLRRPSPFAPRARAPEAEVAAVAAPAPAPAPAPYSDPAVPAAIAAVLGAMAPVDGPRPPAAPALAAAPPRPTAAPPSPAHVAYAPPPPLIPTYPPVTSATPAPAAPPAPPVAAAPRAPAPAAVPMPARDPAPAAAPPTTALFGSAPPPQPAGAGDLGMLQPWTPEPAPEAAKPVAAPAAPAAPAPVEAPKIRQDATQAEYDAFIAAGPYSREGQALLKMLAEKAPEFCRAILRRTVVRGAPLIVFDGARTGSDRRAGFAAPDPSHRSVTIALSPGPLLVERRKGLFKKSMVALPEDPRAWAELGVAPPALDALKKGSAPVAQENGPWGLVRVYGDGSRHGTYSPQEQAGELLERLLLLGLEREGFAASTYAARVWARAARLLFSARVAEDHGTDSFLDPDRRLELREWIERGDESADLLVASWSSSRGNVLDPRRGGPESQSRYERQARESCTRSLLADHLAEAARNLAARVRTLEALVDAGLVSSADAKAAASKAVADEEAARTALLASPPACDGRFGADENGLRLSSALLAEVSRAERAFRERQPGGS